MVEVIRRSIKHNFILTIFDHNVTTNITNHRSNISIIKSVILIEVIKICLGNFGITGFTERLKNVCCCFKSINSGINS